MKYPMKYLEGFLLVVLLAFSATTHAGTPIKPGEWNLVSPSGEITAVDVSMLRKNEFYFYAPKHPISGVYTWDGKLFRMTKPDNPRMGGYVWKRDRGHTLMLVEETPVPISNMKLLSSKMWRLKK